MTEDTALKPNVGGNLIQVGGFLLYLYYQFVLVTYKIFVTHTLFLIYHYFIAFDSCYRVTPTIFSYTYGPIKAETISSSTSEKIFTWTTG